MSYDSQTFTIGMTGNTYLPGQGYCPGCPHCVCPHCGHHHGNGRYGYYPWVTYTNCSNVSAESSTEPTKE